MYNDFLMANSFKLELQSNYTSSIDIRFNQIDYNNLTSSFNTNSPNIYYIGRFTITDSGVNDIRPRRSTTLRNSEYILSGSLVIANTGSNFAEFREETYDLNSWSRLRYQGSKLITETINEVNDGDIVFNNEPNIQRYSRYLLYFESIEDTSRTIKDSSTLYIKYLVDEDGNKITLDGRSNRNVEFINRMFKNETEATVYILNPQDQSVAALSNQNFDIIESCVRYVNVLKPFDDSNTPTLSQTITLEGKDKVTPRKIRFGL